MSEIAPVNALKLSAWLAVHEPALFKELLRRVPATLNARAARTVGAFGDNGLSEVSVNAGGVDPISFADVAPVTSDFTLSDVSFDPGSVSISQESSQAIADAIAAPVEESSQETSGGFWSSIGSGVSGALSSVAQLAKNLSSPQSIQAAGNATAAYFNAQARSAQTSAQQATINTQLARVAQNQAPASLTYVRNPQTGALTPVYVTSSGVQPVTASLLGSLTAGGLSPRIVIGGIIALVIVLALSASRS